MDAPTSSAVGMERRDPAPAAPQGPEFLDRDLCWLEFNRRVLAEARDARNPLLERLMFLGIFTSNLDEFFMKRVGLARLRLAEGETAAEREVQAQRLAAIRSIVLPMLHEQAQCFQDELTPALTAQGIHLLRWDQLSDAERALANEHFKRNVFPVLTPQAVDMGHPFPFISNLSESMVVSLSYPQSDERVFVRVKIPSMLEPWVRLNPEDQRTLRFARLKDLIEQNLPQLFPGMQIQSVMYMRVTRSIAVEREGEDEEAKDLLEMVAEELRLRRMQRVVRLEHGRNPDPWLLEQALERFDLSPDQLYEMPGELDYNDLKEIASLRLPELRFPAWTPVVPPQFSGEAVNTFALIRSGDLLVHHPYESFDQTVLRFIRDAVNDPAVLAIKMTVYRTNDETPFVPLLIKAAEGGKQVACLVELKARFDEHRNIRWAHALEDAGVHVVYGVLGLKTHTKLAMVVRREADGMRTYAHLGTGNYNSVTAKLYTDLGLLTCRPDLADDVVNLFNYLTGRSLKRDYRRLLVAPLNMKDRFLRMIEEEVEHHRAGRPSGIVAKMNQLEDKQIIRALSAASMAGVPIDLIVRGFCVLRPGVPGLTPTVRVRSVIGRFLEHSRIFHFRSGAPEPAEGRFFIGSADWMYRNLDDRVEAITPIDDPALRRRLWDILQVMLQDDRQAWVMTADGAYRRANPESQAPGTHQVLMDRALRWAAGSP